MTLCLCHVVTMIMHCCGLQAVSASSTAVLKQTKHTLSWLLPLSHIHLGAWKRQSRRDIATNRPSKYGGLQSTVQAWLNFEPLQSISIHRKTMGWTFMALYGICVVRNLWYFETQFYCPILASTHLLNCCVFTWRSFECIIQIFYPKCKELKSFLLTIL